METEAKFSFADAATFAAWQERQRIGPFTLAPAVIAHMIDRYLDSDDWRCLGNGYACRIRAKDGTLVATLKSLADTGPDLGDNVRRREELEVTLSHPSGDGEIVGDAVPAWQQAAAWPDSKARTLALRLLAGRRLQHLATVWQERHERPVQDGERVVATFSLDRVRFAGDAEPMLELEVELGPAGTEDDLAEITAVLRNDPAFVATTRSKLRRALAGAPPPPITIERLLAQRSSVARQTDSVALLLRLFDATAGIHQVPPERRRLLELAVRLLDGGVRADAAERAAAARDLLLAQPLPDLTDDDRHVLAAAAGLQPALMDANGDDGLPGRKRLRRDPAFAALDGADARDAVALAVLLQAGRALGSCTLAAITVTEAETILTLAGADAGGGQDAACQLAGLWHEAFSHELRVTTVEALGRTQPSGLRFDQPLGEAGRVIAAVHIDRLQSLAGKLATGDEETLHDARVAARRLRTALRLLRKAYGRRTVRPLDRGLRATGTMLGEVRDLDVLLTALHRTARTLGDDAGLDRLRTDWEQRRQEARTRLQARLASEPHRHWLERMQAFLHSTSSTPRGAERVCDALPALLWRHYAAIRAYDPRVTTASLPELHELRKEVRQLRYALEFFQELLGSDTPELVKRVIVLQDALGTLHDADVRCGLLQRALIPGDGEATTGVAAYLEHSLSELAERRRAFASLWPSYIGPAFRRELAAAVAAV